jgi:predicted glycoside hydrolase/deacetylase ChbG (UPF0249 family)
VTRALIVNADDFGRSPGINRGIIDAHLGGIVTSTTLMVNLPWSEDAAALLQGAPSLAVGLHLNLCYGPPVSSAVPSLLGRDGVNFERDEAQLRIAMRSEDVAREIAAQLERFVALTGRQPDHIDSHRHLHLWPYVSAPLIQVATERHLPVRANDEAHASHLRATGITCPDRCILDFYGAGQVSSDALARILRSLPDGLSELMCHPGYDDDALADSTYRVEREAELATLRDPDIRAMLGESAIELTTFGAN